MKNLIDELKATLEKVFAHLHDKPEVSWKEYKTTEYLQKFLECRGFHVQLFGDCPGLVVEIGDGSPCVALRADMDALWQEVNGKLQANHSCGHDAHMTMGVGAMSRFKRLATLEKAN